MDTSACEHHRHNCLDLIFLRERGVHIKDNHEEWAELSNGVNDGSHSTSSYKKKLVGLVCHRCYKQHPSLAFFVAAFEITSGHQLVGYRIHLPGKKHKRVLLKPDRTHDMHENYPFVAFQLVQGGLLEDFRFILVREPNMMLPFGLGPMIGAVEQDEALDRRSVSIQSASSLAQDLYPDTAANKKVPFANTEEGRLSPDSAYEPFPSSGVSSHESLSLPIQAGSPRRHSNTLSPTGVGRAQNTNLSPVILTRESSAVRKFPTSSISDLTEFDFDESSETSSVAERSNTGPFDREILDMLPDMARLKEEDRMMDEQLAKRESELVQREKEVENHMRMLGEKKQNELNLRLAAKKAVAVEVKKKLDESSAKLAKLKRLLEQ